MGVSSSPARRTRPRSKPWSLRLARRDRELLYLAAMREEVTQSDFIRVAVRARAAQVLGAADMLAHEAQEATA
jgi:uncharacterized protein (DUF1778 family)